MPPLYLKVSLASLPGALVDEANLETAVQERHDLQSLGDGLRAKLDVFEDRRVGREGDGRAGATPRCRSGHLQLALRLAAVAERHLVVVVVAVDFEHAVRSTVRSPPRRPRREVRRRPCSPLRRTCRRRAASCRATSAADLPLYWGCSSTGIPRPSSTTRQLPFLSRS